jgi:hypothetical protein
MILLAANTLSRDGAEFILIYSQGKYFVIKQYLASHGLQTHSHIQYSRQRKNISIKPLPRFSLESGNYSILIGILNSRLDIFLCRRTSRGTSRASP